MPDPDLSLAEGAIAPFAGARTPFYARLVEAVAEHYRISLERPWAKLTDRQRNLLLNGIGDDEPGRGRLQEPLRRERRAYSARYEGAVPFLQRRYQEADTDAQREQIAGYMREVPCPACGGARLKPLSLAVTVAGYNIAELCAMSIGDATKVLADLELSDRDLLIAERVIKEVNTRLAFLCDVGLDYLTLGRSAATLAGGEAQRIRLASQIGSGLVGVLYVLDEPSIGLHQRDNHRLIHTLEHLRELGNTVLVVEHDEDTIRSADWVVDIGPGRGGAGRQRRLLGPGGRPARAPDLADRPVPVAAGAASRCPAMRRDPNGKWLTVRGARENNLRNIDVRFPLGVLTAVTGVSGSGKSTLVNEILFKSLMQRIYRSKHPPGLHRGIDGLQHLDKVIAIDQSPIGRTPRSNPATYTGVFDHIRRLFAATTEAKVRGYQPGRFSFNVKGGRCEACAGDGTIKIEMHFLPDVYVPCEVCKGARYNRDTLDIHFKGKNIAEVLDLPCEEAVDVLREPAGHLPLPETLVEVGLGYVRLGQPAPTLSGGEAQRVKLATELAKRSTGHTIYILDEPTTGLHFEDVAQAARRAQRPRRPGQHGHRHRAQPRRDQDRRLGDRPRPGGWQSGGGEVVAEGTPEDVARCEVQLHRAVHRPAARTGAGHGPGLTTAGAYPPSRLTGPTIDRDAPASAGRARSPTLRAPTSSRTPPAGSSTSARPARCASGSPTTSRTRRSCTPARRRWWRRPPASSGSRSATRSRR